MWEFKDRSDRDCCLIPEATGIIQDMYNRSWSKEKPKPIRLFYETKVYRYERPQEGRYREFTQFGLELLSENVTTALRDECIRLLKQCLDPLQYTFVPAVKRGLGYYTQEGFEVECEQLGAQKQIAGGGQYKEGIGWAIGLERLLLAAKK
jgi:histidyl-tRNA synthetase